MESLGQLAPREELRAKVRAFYAQAAMSELGKSMADPETIVGDAIRELAKVDPTRTNALNRDALVKAVQAELSAVVRPIPDELVEAEVTTASDEILRTWVSALNLAWRLRQAPASPIELRAATLLPDPSTLSDGARWKRRHAAALESLRGTLALAQGGDDLAELTDAFCRKARESLRARPIALPDNLEVAKVGNRIVLRAR
jgi:hypothetical protein